MSVYIEFVGGPLDGTMQRWPEGRPPGQEISLPSSPGSESPPGRLPLQPRRAVYLRAEQRPYGITRATKVLYEFKELV